MSAFDIFDEYCRLGFNCELQRFANVLQYGTGSSIAIIGFAIWPDLTTTQLLNYAIKTRPTVYIIFWPLTKIASMLTSGNFLEHREKHKSDGKTTSHQRLVEKERKMQSHTITAHGVIP